MSAITVYQSPVEKKREGGFTLIELSIVLVIIGLIVGGILTGQDLIKAAEQRATLAQIEKYNTAVNTFRNKFGYIPGDLPYGSANTFGLGVGGGTMTAGGDGNGMITDPQSTNANTPVMEILLFWQQLSQAGLIDGSYGNATTIISLAGVGQVTTTSSYFPLAKLARGNYIYAGSSNAEGFNYYGLTGLNAALTDGASGTAEYGAGSNNLTPLESYNMDKKVDDGMPNTGTVQARGATTASTGVAADILQGPLGTAGVAATYAGSSSTTAVCMTNTAAGSSTSTSDTYDTLTAGSSPATSQTCSLRFRFN